ncbi:MerR family transcriptional regulator [Brevibacillus agri]|uniref:MerR family transcriptional regulator n=1 Tax=Brevibacillus agri TaxID=51101 RepID=UPI003D1F87E2
MWQSRIKQAASETGLPSSTIRHWEKTGLITTARDPKNGYRLFNRSHIHKIMLLRALRAQVYSPSVVELKNAVAEMKEEDVQEARKIAMDTLRYLHQVNCWQMRGVHALYDLCRVLKLVGQGG